MAGIMDEYDPPTPLRKTYCARLNKEEYENQASKCTEEALLNLMQHLESKPESYKRVLRKRKKETEENSGLLSYLKIRLTSLFFEDQDLSEEECSKELAKIKNDMMKAFHYSQETKGRRYSTRLAERRKKELSNDNLTSEVSSPTFLGPSHVSVLPPPPPPPPLPPLDLTGCSSGTPVTSKLLERRPLSTRSMRHPEIKVQRHRSTQPSRYSLQDVMQELKCPGKVNLRTTVERSPGGTPVSGWPKVRRDSNVGYFNSKLVDKFKSIRSPAATPSPLAHCSASPGSFDSPVNANTEESSTPLNHLYNS